MLKKHLIWHWLPHEAGAKTCYHVTTHQMPVFDLWHYDRASLLEQQNKEKAERERKEKEAQEQREKQK